MARRAWGRDRRFMVAALATGVSAAVATAVITRHDASAQRRALPESELRREVQAPAPTVNPSPGARGWPIADKGKQHDIEGWADHVSIRPGQPVQLYVSSTAASFTVKAFRMGWYDGTQATQVWQSGRIAAHEQDAPVVSPATRTASTHWTPSLTVATAGWVPGTYLFRLDGDNGAQRYVPLTVRGPSAAGRLVIVNAVTTWQAYNAWGGASLYHGRGGDSDYGERARVVSFDRPYEGDGAGDFVGNELPLISLAEKLQLPLDYVTDVDLHADPHLLLGARGVITLGHDEYWSADMRAALTDARDAGTNLAFLGANAIFRHIRLQSSPIGPDRLEVAYKDAAEDPLRHTDPKDVTVNWREPPVGRPESDLTGVLYECNPVKADMVITDGANWLFKGSGAYDGLHLPGLVGAEYDRVNPGAPLPRPIEVLAHSPVRCRGVSSFADAAYYTTDSGAGVFASGTSAWVAGLTGCQPATCTLTGRVLTGVTTNLLRAFADGPAAPAHPARDNLDDTHEYKGDPIASRAPAVRTTEPD